MAGIVHGVKWYTTGEARFPVSFPEGRVACRFCDFCHYSHAFNRYKCLLTDEYLYKEYLDERGQECPIHFENEGGSANGV